MKENNQNSNKPKYITINGLSRNTRNEVRSLYNFVNNNYHDEKNTFYKEKETNDINDITINHTKENENSILNTKKKLIYTMKEVENTLQIGRAHV